MQKALFFCVLVFNVIWCNSCQIYQLNLPSADYTYLTWKDTPTNQSITVNFFHTQKELKSPVVYYDTRPKKGLAPYRYHKKAMLRPLPLVVERNFLAANKEIILPIYSAQLTKLNAKDSYYFAIGDKETGYYTKERKFRLPPEDGPIRVVTGGDMGTGRKVPALLSFAAQKSPHAALIGGDISYANGQHKNFGKWLTWLKNWQEQMVTPQGYMVPMILAIGNHELDYNFLTPSAPFYFGLFDQATAIEKSNFVRLLGKNTAVIVLDSGHMQAHSAQNQWLETQLQIYQNKPFKLALYHVPLYPSHRFYYTPFAVSGRKHWLPLFDKYNLTMGLENHDHALKRSKMLKNGKEVTKGGTIYIGDGCWGKHPRSVNLGREYLEKALSVRHFWFLDIDNKSINVEAIDDKGNIVDSFAISK